MFMTPALVAYIANGRAFKLFGLPFWVSIIKFELFLPWLLGKRVYDSSACSPGCK